MKRAHSRWLAVLLFGQLAFAVGNYRTSFVTLFFSGNIHDLTTQIRSAEVSSVTTQNMESAGVIGILDV